MDAAAGQLSGKRMLGRLLIREYKKLQTARLIAENQILRISTAVISDEAVTRRNRRALKISRRLSHTLVFCWARKSLSLIKTASFESRGDWSGLYLLSYGTDNGCKDPGY